MLTEEKLREVFNEMFRKREEHVKETLNSNSKIVYDRLDTLTKNISDLYDSTEFFKTKSIEKEYFKL